MNCCDKCKKDCSGGSTYVEFGETYKLCDVCTKVVESIPNTGVIRRFLSPEDSWNQIEKNMFEARKRRAEGIKVW